MACLLWLGKICNRPLHGFKQFLPLGFFSIDAITGASNWLWLLLLLIDHVGSLVNFPADDSRGLPAHLNFLSCPYSVIPQTYRFGDAIDGLLLLLGTVPFWFCRSRCFVSERIKHQV